MAYAPPPQYPQQPMPSPGPKERPTTVTAAVWIMYLTAATLIATAISLFSAKGAVEDAVKDQVEADPTFAEAGITADDLMPLVTVVFVAVAVVYIVFAVFYVVLGLLDNAGKRPARVLTWILTGIALACCGFGGIINKLGGASATYTVNGEEYNEEATQALADATPAWVTTLEWVSLLLFILGSLAVIILLALPASNEFFRKEPLPPQFPGQPPYGQQPPNPGPPPPYPGR